MHVVFSLDPGGMEHGVVKLVNGIDPAVIASGICSTTPGGALSRLVKPGVPVIELRRRQGNDPSLVWQLYRTFRRERPHVVHTHGWGTLCEGLVAARLARVPVVVHGEHGTLQLKPYQVRVQRAAWGRVDQLLSVSSRLAERMAAETGYPLDRIHVVRNGVDLSRFGSVDRDESRRALGIAEGTLVVGTAGRLVPVKNQGLLLDALAEVVGSSTNVLGIIAGDGPLRSVLEAQGKTLGIGNRVRFVGHRPDIERVYAALDVFVLCSHSEGLSNTILEAMASNVPVVATRVGGADELVEQGRTGTLVPPGSASDLATAILEVAGDDLTRRTLGRAARLRAESVFGLARMLSDYRDTYLDLTANLIGRR